MALSGKVTQSLDINSFPKKFCCNSLQIDLLGLHIFPTMWGQQCGQTEPDTGMHALLLRCNAMWLHCSGNLTRLEVQSEPKFINLTDCPPLKLLAD